MKVVATGASRKYNLKLKEVHRVVNEGEVIEVSPERFKFLSGNNPYGVAFVKAQDGVSVEKVVEVLNKENKSTIVVEPKVKTIDTEPTLVAKEAPVVEEEEPEVVVIKPKKKRAKKVETSEAE